MSDGLQVKVGCDVELLREAWRLRRIVFTDEQGIDGSLDLDGLDPDCQHALVYDVNEAVAVGRMDRVGKIGRVATLKAHRSKGYGSLIMKALEEKATDLGLESTFLYSQESAVGFYLKIGYEAIGERFMEAGIPHQKMLKKLKL